MVLYLSLKSYLTSKLFNLKNICREVVNYDITRTTCGSRKHTTSYVGTCTLRLYVTNHSYDVKLAQSIEYESIHWEKNESAVEVQALLILIFYFLIYFAFFIYMVWDQRIGSHFC